MKVHLAAQTLSDSVASSLDLAREQNVSEFQNSEATSSFLRVINELFDLLNSSSHLSYGQK